MNDGIRPGARVRVQIPRSSPCPLHCLDAVPEVLEAVGTVDTIVAEWDHPVVVRFDLWHLGSQWVDRFKGDELGVVVGEQE
jgi:hypothetical protein